MNVRQMMKMNFVQISFKTMQKIEVEIPSIQELQPVLLIQDLNKYSYGFTSKQFPKLSKSWGLVPC